MRDPAAPPNSDHQDAERPRAVGTGRRWDRAWRGGMWLLLVVCVLLSVLGAGYWHRNLQAEDRSAFRTRASDLAITVGSALNRDTDFVASLRAVTATTPDLDNAHFRSLITASGAAKRYPGTVGNAYYERVSLRDLPAFEAALLADPPNGTPITQYAVTPAGNRASYCLLRFEYLLAPLPSGLIVPADLDVCSAGYTGVANALIGSSSAQFTIPAVTGGIAVIAAPLYTGGVVPTTIAGRKAAFKGWITGSFSTAGFFPATGIPKGMQLQVLFRNSDAPRSLVATAGRAPTHPLTQTLNVDADGPWTVRVLGTATGPGASWRQAGVVLAAGLLLSFLLFAFGQVLLRSRGRALRLVDRRTGELHHQALHDSLTGLPNRALILDRAEQMLARARREHLPVAALFLDLDGFKDVNDTHGHSAGDRLLQEVAQRISASLRPQDTAGRLGGDEFVVLVEGPDTSPDMVAERLLAVLREPFVLDEAHQIFATTQTSIGIAVGNRDRAEDLLHDADIALYQAKDAGGDRYAFFSPRMQAAARERVELTMELRGALDAGEFFLAYQPTFRLNDMAVTGVEALIRWRHPGRGVVPPDEFIPIAEDTGLIIPIGRWVLRTACAEAVSWQGADRRLSLAVNVSGRQLDTDGLVEDVRLALEASGLEPELLTLEITETALMQDPAEGIVRLGALKALGVRIAIDDFGTGYSSLTYLRQFPADAIKIDRSFIAAMADSPESVVIVRTLVQLGKALGIETLAEGIEEREQLEHLQEQDCDSGQGFLFARPLSPQSLQHLLTPSKHRAAPAKS
jgi:diguanylate cyclase (GGDEF)-like protein